MSLGYQICPSCSGRGYDHVGICTLTTARQREYWCFVCKGTGWIRTRKTLKEKT